MGVKPREHPACDGRSYRPTPNPSLAGGGTNTRIAREQDAMWTKPKSVKIAAQFEHK